MTTILSGIFGALIAVLTARRCAKIGEKLFGASLSEPHTSVTALRKCVCIYACFDRPLTVNFK